MSKKSKTLLAIGICAITIVTGFWFGVLLFQAVM